MKLENQVVSLGLAKKLKELGVKYDNSYFVWFHTMNGEWSLVARIYNGVEAGYYKYRPAFTVAELGEMLPLYVNLPYERDENHKTKKRLQLWREKNDSWDVAYNTDGNNCIKEVWEQDKTEVNARAKMLIYLIENKLI